MNTFLKPNAERPSSRKTAFTISTASSLIVRIALSSLVAIGLSSVTAPVAAADDALTSGRSKEHPLFDPQKGWNIDVFKDGRVGASYRASIDGIDGQTQDVEVFIETGSHFKPFDTKQYGKDEGALFLPLEIRYRIPLHEGNDAEIDHLRVGVARLIFKSVGIHLQLVSAITQRFSETPDGSAAQIRGVEIAQFGFNQKAKVNDLKYVEFIVRGTTSVSVAQLKLSNPGQNLSSPAKLAKPEVAEFIEGWQAGGMLGASYSVGIRIAEQVLLDFSQSIKAAGTSSNREDAVTSAIEVESGLALSYVGNERFRVIGDLKKITSQEGVSLSYFEAKTPESSHWYGGLTLEYRW